MKLSDETLKSCGGPVHKHWNSWSFLRVIPFCLLLQYVPWIYDTQYPDVIDAFMVLHGSCQVVWSVFGFIKNAPDNLTITMNSTVAVSKFFPAIQLKNSESLFISLYMILIWYLAFYELLIPCLVSSKIWRTVLFDNSEQQNEFRNLSNSTVNTRKLTFEKPKKSWDFCSLFGWDSLPKMLVNVSVPEGFFIDVKFRNRLVCYSL